LTNIGLLNEGDATITVTPEWSDQKAHQTGAAILEKYYNGAQVVAEFELAEVLNWPMWADAFPTGEHQMDDSTPPQDRVAFNKILSTEPYVGQKGTAVDQMFVFRPVRLYVDASTETACDVVIPRGVSVGPVVMTFSTDNPQVLPFEVHGLFDPSATEGEHLLWRGLTTGTFETWA
jgi:hypothetical protein